MHFCVAKTLLPNRFSLSKYASVLQLAIAGERRLSGVPKPEEHGHSVVSQERDLGLVTLGSRDSVHRFMRRGFSYPVHPSPYIWVDWASLPLGHLNSPVATCRAAAAQT